MREILLLALWLVLVAIFYASIGAVILYDGDHSIYRVPRHPALHGSGLVLLLPIGALLLAGLARMSFAWRPPIGWNVIVLIGTSIASWHATNNPTVYWNPTGLLFWVTLWNLYVFLNWIDKRDQIRKQMIANEIEDRVFIYNFRKNFSRMMKEASEQKRDRKP